MAKQKYECPACGKKCKNIADLEKHVDKKHPDSK